MIEAQDARQQSFDFRTNTMVNIEVSPPLPQSPFSPRDVTFPFSSRNEHSCKIPSVSLTREVKCEPQKQDMTALSMAILCHAEKLQSLLHGVKDSEIPEIVSLLFFRLDYCFLTFFFDGFINRTRLKVCTVSSTLSIYMC